MNIESAFAPEIAAFLASGGQIEVLPPFQYRPLPRHSAPKVSHRSSAPAGADEQQRRRDGAAKRWAQADAALLPELLRREALGQSKTRVQDDLKLSYARLERLIDQYGLEFTHGSAGRPSDEMAELELADKIRQAIAAGMSTTRTLESLHIGHHRLKRICTKYGLTFSQRGK